MALCIGDNVTKVTEVTEDKLALTVGSGDLKVLATPVVISLMENVSAELAQKGLEAGITTVGTEINVKHTSPTPLGALVWIKSTLIEQDNRIFKFEVEAYDKSGTIATGNHTRVSVNGENFQNKADNKFNG